MTKRVTDVTARFFSEPSGFASVKAAEKQIRKRGIHIKRNWKTSFAPGVLFLCAFGIWTVLVQTVDVQSIGAGGTSIGMAAWNLGFHQWTGVHMWVYTLTDWLGLVPVGVCMVFGGLGLVQLVRRKSLWRVDRDILILGVYYVLVIGCYLFLRQSPSITAPF